MTIHAQGSTVGPIFLTALTIYLAAKGARRIMRSIPYRPKWLSRPLRRWHAASDGIICAWYALRMARALRAIEKTLAWATADERLDRQELRTLVWEVLANVEQPAHPENKPLA